MASGVKVEGPYEKIFEGIWKSLVIGMAYTAALMTGGILVRLAGLSLPEVKDAQATVMWSFVGGTMAGLFLGPIAASIAASWTRQILIWGSVLLFNLVSVAIEGYFFAPSLIGNSPAGLILQQIVVALITGWIITRLFAPKGISAALAPSPRSLFSWTWRFLLSTLSYVIFYLIFGALNYELVTAPYYETHAGGLTVPSPDVVLRAELIRGAVIVASVLCFLHTLRTAKKRLILLRGLILFSVGGLVPLTMQASALPFILLLASAVEIHFQNFPTEAVTALLLGQSE